MQRVEVMEMTAKEVLVSQSPYGAKWFATCLEPVVGVPGLLVAIPLRG